ncbi:MAG: BrnT family toxin [Phycisphaerales bacterium]|jgi:uncharacterized DUF497 family protein|nr:BrnT family toxin [Phycisphaerales bacterium]
MEFEWDESKERDNLRKHGVSFAHAIEAFRDPKGIRLKDVTHSSTERRYYWVGEDLSGKIITVRFTQRGAKIRIIGCGYWRKYRRYYYEANKIGQSED